MGGFTQARLMAKKRPLVAANNNNGVSDMSIAQNQSNEAALPALHEPQLGNLPAALRGLGWAFSDPMAGDGQKPKAPRGADGRLLSPSDPAGWVTYEQACNVMESDRFRSVGVLLDGNGIVGIDLDHVEEMGTKHPRIARIVRDALARGAYLEASPSGTGIRGFVFGSLPAHAGEGIRSNTHGVEIYAKSRYLRVTGVRLDGCTADNITSDQTLIDELLDLIGRSGSALPAQVGAAQPAQAPSPEAIERVAAKVSQRDPHLWSGNLALACNAEGAKYGPSEADMALCSVIRNVALDEGVQIGAIAALIELVMERSGLASLQHGDGTQKWLERADYRQRTIQAVCAGLQGSPAVLKRNAGVSPQAGGDIALGERFAGAQRDKLLWIPEMKQWLTWDGTAWSACSRGEEVEAARQVVFGMVDEAKDLMHQDTERGQKAMREAKSAQRRNRIEAMLDLAKSQGMTRSVVDLDADPMLLGVRNGVVDLRTGDLLEARPEHLITRQAKASYEPESQCPRWLQFLDDIFEGDQTVIGAVQRLLGYTITGSNTEEVMIVAYGSGANGKSVFHNVVSHIMGDYAIDAPSDLIVQRPNQGGPTPELAMLAGKRLLGLNELHAGARLDAQRLKLLAGRELITARPLYGKFFSFVPTFTAWLRTNHRPVITDSDYGVWRRLVLLPFTRQFTENERDARIEQKLLTEGDGILSWMVRGAVEWHTRGLVLPARLHKEREAYKAESDLLAQFLEECTGRSVDERVEQSALYQAWVAWCGANGVKPTTKVSFSRRLGELGIGQSKSNGRRFYTGLSMTQVFAAAPL